MGNIKNVNGELIKRYGMKEGEGNWRIQMTVRFDIDYYYHLHIQLEHTAVTLQVM